MKGERECAGKRWRQTAVFLCCYFERLAAALLPWSGPAYFCPGLVLLLFLAPERERKRERESAVRETARLGRVTEREKAWDRQRESFLYRGWEAGTELTFSPVTSPRWSTWWNSAGTARRADRRGKKRPGTTVRERDGSRERKLGRWDRGLKLKLCCRPFMKQTPASLQSGGGEAWTLTPLPSDQVQHLNTSATLSQSSKLMFLREFRRRNSNRRMSCWCLMWSCFVKALKQGSICSRLDCRKYFCLVLFF